MQHILKFIRLINSTYATTELAELIIQNSDIIENGEDMGKSASYASNKKKFVNYAVPTLVIGQNIKILPDYLRSAKNFFVLFDDGISSSRAALERANLILSYEDSPLSPTYSSRYAAYKGKNKALITPRICFPMISKSLVGYEEKTIVVSLSKNNLGVNQYLKHLLIDQEFDITHFRTSKKPRFIITDNNDMALYYICHSVPVVMLPNKTNLYNYLCYHELVFPFTMENVHIFTTSTTALQNQSDLLAKRFTNMPDLLNAIVLDGYYSHYDNWRKEQNK